MWARRQLSTVPPRAFPPAFPADPSVPPGPLTHLSLRDSSEARLQSDGPSLLGSWTRSPPEHATILREGVRTCLQQRCEQTVWILHAKVAQKSYGNEKRPPICGDRAHRLRLHGTGRSVRQHSRDAEAEFRRAAGLKGIWLCQDPVHLRRRQEEALPASAASCAARRPGAGHLSQSPHQVCISSGSKVSLFNRLRSQTVSTRYLSVEDGAFVASARQWAAFTLHLADERCSQGDFPPQEGYIRYGSLVQLVCTVTGVTLPPMIIRKVAKQCALLDVDEPISQLHKCAFQFPGDTPGGGGTYLCLATEKVVRFQASLCPKEANRALLNDSSCWTIIGTESVEFSFSTSLACTREPVTPVPLINTLELSGGGDVATLELHGENFHAGLKVWFGDVEAETMYRSPRSLVCVVPDVAAFGSDWRWLRTPITVPVSLLRADALFYPSAFSFTYTPEYSARPRPPNAHEPAPDADALLESIHHEFTRTNFHLFCPS
nr:recombining binding protein suppressor of hairless-like protein isoform X7 [Peromyscus maniculatus bairdii]